jgi:hypothetical protein
MKKQSMFPCMYLHSPRLEILHLYKVLQVKIEKYDLVLQQIKIKIYL